MRIAYTKIQKLTERTAFFCTSMPIIFLLMLSACSSGPEIEIPEEIAALENLQVIPVDAEPMHDIELDRVARFGDTDDVMFGRLGMSSVGDDGRIYIADGSQNVIHAYGSDGTHLSQIGREGDGPGEFRQIRNLQVEGDRLHIMDMRTMRISTYNLNDYRFVSDLAIQFEFNFTGGFSSFPGIIYLYDADHFLVHFTISYSSGASSRDETPMEHGKLLSRSDGSFSEEKLYEFRSSETLIKDEGTSMYMMGVDYKRGTQHMVTDDQLIWGWTEDLLFKIHDMDGNYVSAIYQPFDNIPLNRSEVVSQYADRDEPWRSMVRNDVMPETWPAFSSAKADDEGRIWAAVYAEDDEIWNWRVFTQDGELYASFDWPRDIQIRDIKNDHIYTRETDEETGLVEIVKYRIILD